MVTICGPDESAKHFIVHREFASYHSPVFKAAFESKLMEGRTQTYRIDGPFDDNVIRVLAHWLCTSEIDLNYIKNLETGNLIQLPQARTGDRVVRNIDPFVELLICLWVLANRLLVPKLQNAALEKLSELVMAQRLLPSQKSCEFAYEHTAEGSSLRAWIVICWAMETLASRFREVSRNLPQEMLHEVATYLVERYRGDKDDMKCMPIDLDDYKVPEN